MLWKRCIRPLLVFACAACLARPASAQFGGSDLPDLSGLAGAIENSVKGPAGKSPAAKKLPPGTIYTSGLTVPSVHPGETSKGFVHQLRGTFERQKAPPAALKAMQQLEDGMPAMLSGLETYMVKQGFAKRDMGVAFGVFFAENWKTATKQTLSDAAEANLVRTVSDAAAVKYKAKFAKMTPADKEKTYENLLSGTMILSEFAQVYGKAGKTAEEGSMRKAAGALFTKVVGVEPESVDISLDGNVSGPAPANAAPAADAPPNPAPPATDTGKPGARALPSGHGVKPSQIAGIYCRPTYGGGAGGFVSVSYEPVLALKDGTYCGGFEVPPSDLDIAASRRTHPGQWGRWRKSGAGLETVSSKGVWEKSGWIGPLPEAGPSERLSGTYKSIGGGGTAAYGGDVFVAIEDSLTFLPGGQFRSGHTSSVTAPGVAGGASRAAGGTYALSRGAILLRYKDGTVRRWSYARTADGLVFLHGKAYTKDD